MAFFEAMRGPPFSGPNTAQTLVYPLDAVNGEGIGRDAAKSSRAAENGCRDVQSITEALHSLLGVWKGRFEVLGKLD